MVWSTEEVVEHGEVRKNVADVIIDNARASSAIGVLWIRKKGSGSNRTT